MDLLQAVASHAEQALPTGAMLASQRLLIEVLLQATNIGLMEHRLVSLLDGDIGGNCAASWPGGAPATPALAHDTGRGWRMTGLLPAIPNLDPHWFMVSMPVSFGAGDGFSLVLLGSEEDGVVRRTVGLDDLAGTRGTALELSHVFLREDEVLSSDGPAAVHRVAVLALGLKAALYAGACRQALRSEAAGGPASAAVDRLFGQVLAGVAQQERVTSALCALRQWLARLAAPKANWV